MLRFHSSDIRIFKSVTFRGMKNNQYLFLWQQCFLLAIHIYHQDIINCSISWRNSVLSDFTASIVNTLGCLLMVVLSLNWTLWFVRGFILALYIWHRMILYTLRTLRTLENFENTLRCWKRWNLTLEPVLYLEHLLMTMEINLRFMSWLMLCLLINNTI